MEARVLVVTIAFQLILLFINMMYAALPILYPAESEAKGVTPSQYGIVLGVNSLSSLIATPLFAKYGEKIGLKRLNVSGGIVQGVTALLFGTVGLIGATWPFIGASFVLRLSDGIGQGAWMSAMMVIMLEWFPARAGTISSLNEANMGTCYVVGPLIGSALTAIGGFGISYYLVGGLVLLLSMVVAVTLPAVITEPAESGTLSRFTDMFDSTRLPTVSTSLPTGVREPVNAVPSSLSKPTNYQTIDSTGLSTVSRNTPEPCSKSAKPVAALSQPNMDLAYRDFLTSVPLATPALDFLVISTCYSMMETVLGSHLTHSEARASQFQVSLAFAIRGTSTVLSSLFIGHYADRMDFPVILSIAGHLISLFAVSFIGPVPYLPLEPSVNLTYAGMFIHGVGFLLVQIPAYASLKKNAKMLGYAVNAQNDLILISVCVMMPQVGMFLGPTFGGLLMDAIGFRLLTLCVQIVYLLAVFTDSFALAYTRAKTTMPYESS